MRESLMGAPLLSTGVAMAQTPPDPAAATSAQREAMRALAPMNGAWRGAATTLLPGGERRTITQTERIGPFLGDAEPMRVFEMRLERIGDSDWPEQGAVSAR